MQLVNLVVLFIALIVMPFIVKSIKNNKYGKLVFTLNVIALCLLMVIISVGLLWLVQKFL